MKWAFIVSQLQPVCPTIKAYIVMTDSAHMPAEAGSDWKCYDDLVAAEMPNLPFIPQILDENTACGLCYTSGTTGRPKVQEGPRHSHFSLLLSRPIFVWGASGDCHAFA